MSEAAILIVCEGSGQIGHVTQLPGQAICAMCGSWQPYSGNGIVQLHTRHDILAEIDQGDR